MTDIPTWDRSDSGSAVLDLGGGGLLRAVMAKGKTTHYVEWCERYGRTRTYVIPDDLSKKIGDRMSFAILEAAALQCLAIWTEKDASLIRVVCQTLSDVVRVTTDAVQAGGAK